MAFLKIPEPDLDLMNFTQERASALARKELAVRVGVFINSGELEKAYQLMKPVIQHIEAAKPAHRNGIDIGTFSIRPGTQEGKAWIERSTGEGGDFSIDHFEEVVRQYYTENF